MSKKKSKKNSNSEREYFIITPRKKKKLLGLFLIVFSLFLFLSILSYSRADEAAFSYTIKDLLELFSPSAELSKNISNAHNWLGIIGAYLAYFFIHSTIGYFSLVFPVVIFLWGYTVLKAADFKLSIYITNFLIATGLILAAFFGVLQTAPEIGLFPDVYELSGNIGKFFGTVLSRLLGGLGSIIFLFALLVATLIISFDIKLSVLYYKLIQYFENSSSGKKDEVEVKIKKETGAEEIGSKKKEKESPLKTLLRKKDKAVEEQELETEERAPETRIKILKKEETPAVKTVEEIYDQVEKKKSKENKEEEIEERVDFTKEADLPDQWEEKINYKPPTLDLLQAPEEEEIKVHESELKRNAQLLKDKLALFDIQIEDITVTPGPVVTLYEIVPAPGVKISRIVSLEHDIALALAARGIRIIAPIPGKSAIGVEIPNAEASIVRAYSVLSKLKGAKAELPLALGKTISGDVYISDLATMPHLLIAGSTGSGKSVGINMIINSLLYSKHPSDIKFVIIDPKKIELSFYKKLSKHFLAVSPDLNEEIITNPSNALLALKAVEFEMEKRYDKLAKAGVRNIMDYNKKVLNPRTKPKDTDEMKHHKLPYIIVIIDELADLMITSGKEVEEPIARLAQLARAVGIHLILATQRPSVNVITGVIKANFSSRIAYQVASKIDSRTILDMNGAEQLLGRGDMLFLPTGMPKPIRIQNAFISTEEVEKVVNHIYIQEGYSKRYFLPSLQEKQKSEMYDMLSDLDPMFEEAARVVVRHQQGSVSLLQRRLKLGYSRAARIIDQLEQVGIVGPSEGSKAREVIVENEEQLETILRSL
ncbi:cell division FtsK/SpoIIIE [Melioribacter roseus P3M-2]|uniref:Cell division FtsK/SpoIIIE n=1 Tax=Melioribacter roseus (strain DSM 23840 / JCM 17771 / VKM B-2668 / P3M-2) TaxID=1191523 RepID=I7A188_MELRP|nr:DNA translocase FtsK [Melioribacter roseus]AFN74963.1 cell division FtsK/SpoIIIE [Melioribacter roseus P3M-2]